jgi:peptidoglycan hydrolase-like protein with peptidoglycan-binding domain
MSEPIPMLAPNSTNVKRTLYRGMRGNDVAYIQEVLDELNSFYKFCPSKPVKASGYFGDETAKLVKFFQYKADLIPDSHFDRDTNNAMEQWWNQYLNDMQFKVQAAKVKQAFDQY